MTFQELLQSVPWPMVETYVYDHYKAHGSFLDKHKDVYDLLLTMDPVSTGMRLRLTIHNEAEPGDEPDYYVDINGSNGTKNRDMPDFKYMNIPDNDPRADELVWFALEFQPWQHWLGMEIEQETLDKFPPEAIVAHCLWEMTFISFDEKEIRAQHDMLEKTVEDIKAGRVKGKTFNSAREMIEDMERRRNEKESQDSDENGEQGHDREETSGNS